MNKLILLILISSNYILAQNIKYYKIVNNEPEPVGTVPGVVWDSETINIMTLNTSIPGPLEYTCSNSQVVSDISDAAALWSSNTNYTLSVNSFSVTGSETSVLFQWSDDPNVFPANSDAAGVTPYKSTTTPKLFYDDPHWWNYKRFVALNKRTDRNWDWYSGGYSAASNHMDCYSVALHELGHVIGLSHSGNLQAVMWPKLSTGYRYPYLTSDDVNGANECYIYWYNGIVGIQDGIFFQLLNSSYSLNTNYSSGSDYYRIFQDLDGSGTTLKNWETFQLKLYHECGTVNIDLGTTSFYINSNQIPTNFQWVRDGSGRVLGKMVARCEDSDGTHHTSEADIAISGIPYNTITSGAICGDHTWSGNVTVTGDITVFEEATLTISAGTNVTFNNNSSIVVYGSLDVNGTSASKVTLNFNSGSLNTEGVKVYSGGTVDINYGQISNAKYGVYSQSDDVTLTNTKITGCTNGIYLNGASPTLTNCLIQNNTYGIYALNYSSPTLSYNTIRNNSSWGIYGIIHAYIDLFGSKNLITGNGGGILLRNNSVSYAGYVSGPGFNSIYSNTGLEFWAVQYSNANLKTVYWGSSTGPTSSDYTVDATSSCDYSDYLDRDEGAGSTLTKSFAKVDDIDLANEFYSKGDYESAKILYKKIIKENEKDNITIFALEGLNHCYIKQKKKGLKTYIQTELKPKYRSKNDKFELQLFELEAYWYLQEGNIESAISNYDYILTNFISDKEAVKVTLYNKGVAYLNYKGDKEKASELFDELKRKYPKDVLVTLFNEALIGDSKFNNKSILEKEDELVFEEEADVSSFELFKNYPNPFNPTTTISYQLPEAGFVTLKVYDMLGKEVTRLVDGKNDAGKYNVNFDASNLASGIYVYRITVQSFEGSQKNFTKSAKMLLLK